VRYNPIGYHLGTVWRTITRSISTGFRRYGFAEEPCRIFTGSASPFSIPPATWEVLRTAKGWRSEVLFEELW